MGFSPLLAPIFGANAICQVKMKNGLNKVLKYQSFYLILVNMIRLN